MKAGIRARRLGARAVGACSRTRVAVVLAGILTGIHGGCSPPPSEEPDGPPAVVGRPGKGPGRFHRPRALAVVPRTGEFYVADRTGRIQLFGPDGTFRLQWSMPSTSRGQPVGLAVDGDGNLLVSDTHYQRVLRFTPDGSRILMQWGRSGTGPGEFTTCRGIAVDSDGNVYVGDCGGGNDRIEKFTSDGRFLLQWGGQGEEPGRLRRPQGMAIERRGDEEFLLVADSVNHRVERFTLDGVWAGSIGSFGYGRGKLRYPYSVAVGPGGMMYVCEWGNHRVQRFDSEGRSRGVWGSPGRAPGELYNPWDVAVGPDGRILVADCENHRVQVFLWSAGRSDMPDSAGEVSP